MPHAIQIIDQNINQAILDIRIPPHIDFMQKMFNNNIYVCYKEVIIKIEI